MIGRKESKERMREGLHQHQACPTWCVRAVWRHGLCLAAGCRPISTPPPIPRTQLLHLNLNLLHHNHRLLRQVETWTAEARSGSDQHSGARSSRRCSGCARLRQEQAATRRCPDALRLLRGAKRSHQPPATSSVHASAPESISDPRIHCVF